MTTSARLTISAAISPSPPLAISDHYAARRHQQHNDAPATCLFAPWSPIPDTVVRDITIPTQATTNENQGRFRKQLVFQEVRILGRRSQCFANVQRTYN
ncbi:hypothetical protein CGGC5_v017105 [Colletotrichum fructicola Nara gc5]|uniref:Uncharacterized protein n=1 Tax=Colletotrichum fructicola (strain Nara gc5) TaxID=1213859 RepID=A0A7J6ICM2_COLFN|nr:hypothetical protein CFRS1_v015292 [Colletotrichum fructicola]KAF4474087.1 hypothetical protein CGGC5_v017105 [Colletotrichum fructicola Nara gc5]